MKALVLQGPELLRRPTAPSALAKVPFIAVMATHEAPGWTAPTCVLPAAVWAEVDGTFTNYQRRVQRIHRAFAAPGDARPRWELAAALLQRLGAPLAATSAREVFALLAQAVPDYAGLDYRGAGRRGRGVPAATAASAPGGEGLMARPRRHRRPQPEAGRRPDPARDGDHLQEHGADAVPAPGLDHPVPRAEAQQLRAATAASTSSPQRMDGTPKCVACYMCATVCPAECIYIEAGERPGADIEKYPTRFEIDLLRCVYCGFCVDACPEEAIIMSRENDLVGTTRAELIIDRDRLMDRGKLVEYGAGYRPDEHDVRRPVRIAALERLKSEHGIVPGMPRRPE